MMWIIYADLKGIGNDLMVVLRRGRSHALDFIAEQ